MTRMALSLLLWVILGSTLAGIALIIVLMIPSMQSQAMHMISLAAIVGFVVAIPLSVIAARALTQKAA